jgi:hypothetical protein
MTKTAKAYSKEEALALATKIELVTTSAVCRSSTASTTRIGAWFQHGFVEPRSGDGSVAGDTK